MAMTNDPMPTEDRERMILQLLEGADLALPLTPIHWNLRNKRGATWSQRTTRRRLESLVEQEYVEILDVGNRYYQVTDAGREYLKKNQD